MRYPPSRYTTQQEGNSVETRSFHTKTFELGIVAKLSSLTIVRLVERLISEHSLQKNFKVDKIVKTHFRKIEGPSDKRKKRLVVYRIEKFGNHWP